MIKQWIKNMITPTITPLSLFGWISWFLMLDNDTPRWVALFVLLPIVSLSLVVWFGTNVKDDNSTPNEKQP